MTVSCQIPTRTKPEESFSLPDRDLYSRVRAKFNKKAEPERGSPSPSPQKKSAPLFDPKKSITLAAESASANSPGSSSVSNEEDEIVQALEKAMKSVTYACSRSRLFKLVTKELSEDGQEADYDGSNSTHKRLFAIISSSLEKLAERKLVSTEERPTKTGSWTAYLWVGPRDSSGGGKGRKMSTLIGNFDAVKAKTEYSDKTKVMADLILDNLSNTEPKSYNDLFLKISDLLGIPEMPIFGAAVEMLLETGCIAQKYTGVYIKTGLTSEQVEIVLEEWGKMVKTQKREEPTKSEEVPDEDVKSDEKYLGRLDEDTAEEVRKMRENFNNLISAHAAYLLVMQKRRKVKKT